MNWRGVSLELTLLTTEACWLYALSSVLTGIEARELALPFPAVLVLILAAFYIARFLQHLDLPLAIVRGIGVGLGGLCIFIAIRVAFADSAGFYHQALLMRAQLLAAAMGIILWWRGARLAQKEETFDTVLASLRMGIMAMVFAIAMESLRPGPKTVAGVILPFFAFGLMALALGHWARVGKDWSSRLQGRWVGIVIAAIAVVIVVGILLSLLTAEQTWNVGLRLPGGIGRFLDRALWLALKPVEYLVKLIQWFLVRFVRVPELASEGGEETTGTLEDMIREAEKYIKPLPDWLLQTLKWALIVLICGWLARWLAHLFGPLLARGRRATEEIRESVFSKEALRQDLDSLVQGLLSRLRRRKQPPSTRSLVGLTGEALDNIRAVFQLYLDLLSLATSRGFVRKNWQTPLELQVGLENIFPSREVGRITLAFTRARYGQYPPTNEELEQLRHDWQSIRE